MNQRDRVAVVLGVIVFAALIAVLGSATYVADAQSSVQPTPTFTFTPPPATLTHTPPPPTPTNTPLPPTPTPPPLPLPPTLSSITMSLPDGIVAVDMRLDASAIFTDPIPPDLQSVRWDWGDGTNSAGTVDQGDGVVGMVTGSHTYNAPGVYSVQLTVIDSYGQFDTSTFDFVVVYDATGGFVTGGGWIDSPAGAYIPDPSLAGRANFGFVSKYKKGASAPTGSTEFEFQVADLRFRSTDYDWLVIAGAKAMYKGTGTINGNGTYRFLLSAADGELKAGDDFETDGFRIKIWDKDYFDSLLYDNQLGDRDKADPATPISGGSIVVHEAKGK